MTPCALYVLYSLVHHGSEASFRQVLNPPITFGFESQLLSTTEEFLGAFAKLRRATISFVMSICPSASKQLGYHRTDFHEIRYLRIRRKTVQKIQVSLEPDKNKGYFTWEPHSLVFSLRGRVGRNQSTVMWPVWLWHTASWASSWG